MGITFVAGGFGVVPIDEPFTKTVISRSPRRLRRRSVAFYLFQLFTAMILFLAANTSYTAFPRLARSSPGRLHTRQFSFQGDSLAFTSAFLLLSAVAIALIVLFAGDTHALIPLYSVGVFLSFTISQSAWCGTGCV